MSRLRDLGRSPRQLGTNPRATRAAQAPVQRHRAASATPGGRRAVAASLGAAECPSCSGAGWVDFDPRTGERLPAGTVAPCICRGRSR